MKIKQSLVLIIIFISFSLNARENLPIKIGTYENSPKIFTDAEGNTSGFWADISNYIAEKEDWELEWVHGNWDQCLERLESGEIDIMVDVGVTPERQRMFLFSNETVLISWTRLYIQQGVRFDSLMDLEEKKIAGLKESVNINGPEGLKDIITRFNLNSEIVEMDNYFQVFEAIQSGKVFAGITNKDFGTLHELKYNIERTPIIFQPARLQFAFNKNSEISSKLIKIINSSLIELKKDSNSIYYTSIDKYLGGIEEIEVVPYWLKYVIVFILSSAVIIFLFIIFLKYQVNQKTMLLQQDIANRKKMEEELQKSDALLNSTQQLTKVGGWKYKIKEQLMFWTEETYIIHDIDINTIIDGSTKHIDESIKCYDEDDRSKVIEAFEKCCSQGIPYDMIFPLTTFKNRKIWIRTSAQAIKEDGQIISVIGNIMDITESKNSEIELSKYRNHLEELVKERTEKLEKQNEELEHFNDLFVDREFRIKELRDKVKELENK